MVLDHHGEKTVQFVDLLNAAVGRMKVFCISMCGSNVLTQY